MFKLINKERTLPDKYPCAERELATVKTKSKTVVDGFELRHKVDYIPQVGLQEEVCSSECNLIFMCGQGTAGKAQPYDANVLTPKGFVKMGSLKVGDKIADVNGDVQKVEKIFEQGEKEVYRLTFDDGAETECCAEHLWKVYIKPPCGEKEEECVMQFEDIRQFFDKGGKVQIPTCNPVSLRRVDIQTHPASIGYIVCNIAMQRMEDIEYEDRGLGLHLFYSERKRRVLLQSIAKGKCTKLSKKSIDFKTVHKQLALDVQWLARSLGFKAQLIKNNASYMSDGSFGYDVYRVKIFANLGTLFETRHSEFERREKRKLVAYRKVGVKKCRCLLVSGKEHLYITDDFIVTHNTFALYFKAIGGCDKKDFTARIISYQALDSAKGSSMLRDGIKVCGDFAGCEVSTSNYPTFFWKKWNSNLQLIHCNFNGDNPEERERFEEYAKKQQASLIMIDEATAIQQFSVFTFWFMRNRDDSGMIPQMILTFNPKHKHWTTQMLRDAGFLDDNGYYLRKDMIGKIRYFYIKGDNPEGIIWGDTKEEVVQVAGLTLKQEDKDAGMSVYDYVKSFTVYTGTASDNRELVNATKGQSVANLHAVGGTQRMVVGEAYFGPIINEDNNVNRRMILQLWENPVNNDLNMYGTFDVGGGKGDSAPFIVWRGLQMIAIEYFQGEPYELAGWIKTMLARYGIPVEHFAYDGTGFGYWMQGLTNGISITSNRRALQEYDEHGNQVTRDEFFNCRSQLLGKLEVALKRGDISCKIDKEKRVKFGTKNETRRFVDVLIDGVNLFITSKKNGKTYYNSKEEFKARFKYSPGEMDAMSLRMVFELDTRERKQPKPKTADDAYDDLYKNPLRMGAAIKNTFNSFRKKIH